MDITVISEMSLKEKERIVQAVFNQYHFAKDTLNKLQFEHYYPKMNYCMVKESNSSYNSYEKKLLNKLERSYHCEKLITYIDQILIRLPEHEQEIIIHDYQKPDRHHWWELYYSKSSYYRVKNKALNSLLFYLMNS